VGVALIVGSIVAALVILASGQDDIPARIGLAALLGVFAFVGVTIVRTSTELRADVLVERGLFATSSVRLRDIQHIGTRTTSGGENGTDTSITVRVGGRTTTVSGTSRSGSTVRAPRVLAFRSALERATVNAGGTVDDASPADALRSADATGRRPRVMDRAPGAPLAHIRLGDWVISAGWTGFAALAVWFAVGMFSSRWVLGSAFAVVFVAVALTSYLSQLTTSSTLFADRLVVRHGLRRRSIPLAEIDSLSVIAFGEGSVPGVEMSIEHRGETIDLKESGMVRSANLAALDFGRLLYSRISTHPSR
jgi:hypothetical protein